MFLPGSGFQISLNLDPDPGTETAAKSVQTLLQKLFNRKKLDLGSGLEKFMDLDPVCHGRLDPDPDPVNIRPDPKP